MPKLLQYGSEYHHKVLLCCNTRSLLQQNGDSPQRDAIVAIAPPYCNTDAVCGNMWLLLQQKGYLSPRNENVAICGTYYHEFQFCSNILSYLQRNMSVAIITVAIDRFSCSGKERKESMLLWSCHTPLKSKSGITPTKNAWHL